jgi:hypothetical protein
MVQPDLQLGDAALTGAQETLEIGKRPCKRMENRILMLELARQLAMRTKALAGLEIPLRIGTTAGEPIEGFELCGTEAAGKACTRQPQRLADRAHADLRQTIERFSGPSQHRERQ